MRYVVVAAARSLLSLHSDSNILISYLLSVGACSELCVGVLSTAQQFHDVLLQPWLGLDALAPPQPPDGARAGAAILRHRGVLLHLPGAGHPGPRPGARQDPHHGLGRLPRCRHRQRCHLHVPAIRGQLLASSGEGSTISARAANDP